MSDGLNVMIIDDEAHVCEVIAETVRSFYTWGEVLAFTDVNEAIAYCKRHDMGVMIFVIDVFVGDNNGFAFLDEVEQHFPSAREDAIMITGNASDDVVDMCVASQVNHLLEKPVKPYALQLAVRSIVSKYLNFAKKLLQDPDFADSISKF